MSSQGHQKPHNDVRLYFIYVSLAATKDQQDNGHTKDTHIYQTRFDYRPHQFPL